jgi:hypothetical protein
MKAFNKAQQGMPINVSPSGGPSSYDEVEYMRNGQRAIRVKGREFLGEVRVGLLAGVKGLGERLPHGMYPVNPRAFGGRLELFASEFEEHDVEKLCVVYEPVVPTTTPGAIAIYFRNDVGTTTLETGRNELAHAATHSSFVQTPVWDEATVDIDPENVITRYFDEEIGDFRFEAQGLIQVLTASTFTGSPDQGPLGNLYLCYDMHFFGSELDYEVEEVQEFSLVVDPSNTVFNTQGNNVLFGLSGQTGIPNVTISGTSLVPADLVNYLVYGTVAFGAPTVPWNQPDFDFEVGADSEVRQFTDGQGLWMRVVDEKAAGGGLYMSIYADLASANEASTDDADRTNGQLYWSSGSTIPNVLPGNMQIDVRAWHLSDT